MMSEAEEIPGPRPAEEARAVRKWANPGGDPRPIVVLLGPTCLGKTALAIALAERMRRRGVPLEVIGADARQIYRGLSVGTARPTAEEREAVPHHMIDVADPGEAFSAARFAHEARECAEVIYGRGALPLVVGGCGLYIRAFLEGLFQGPGAQPSLRGRLEKMAEREGTLVLHRRLAACDPETAARVHPNDRRRVIRALEVYESTGRSISTLRAESRGGGFLRPLYIGVACPPPLHAQRIEARVRRMLVEGMTGEAAALAEAGLTHTRAFEGLGYAEALALHRGEADFETSVEQISRLHRAYAKRQRTWFRKVRGVRWLDAAEMGWEDVVESAGAALWSYLEGFPSFLRVLGSVAH